MPEQRYCCSGMMNYIASGFIFIADDGHYYVHAIGKFGHHAELEIIRCPYCGQELPLNSKDRTFE